MIPNVTLSPLRSAGLYLFISLLTKYLVNTYNSVPACKVKHSEYRGLFCLFVFLLHPKVYCLCAWVCVCVWERERESVCSLHAEMQPACKDGEDWRKQAERGIFYAWHRARSLSTPFLKCIALGIPSDKLPLGDTVLPPPPASNLKPDIASNPVFSFSLFEIKWYVRHVLSWMQNPTMHLEVSEASNFGSAQVARCPIRQRKSWPSQKTLPGESSPVSGLP